MPNETTGGESVVYQIHALYQCDGCYGYDLPLTRQANFYYCRECYDNRALCVHCGRLVHRDSMLTTVGGAMVCRRHIPHTWIHCLDCDRAAPSTARGDHACTAGPGPNLWCPCSSCAGLTAMGQTMSGLYLCAACVGNAICACDSCGATILRVRARNVPTYGPEVRSTVCDLCVNDFERCSHCGYFYDYIRDEQCGCPGADGLYDDCECSACYQGHSEESRYSVNSYSFRPALKFQGGAEVGAGSRSDKTLYLGFELEVGVDRYQLRSEAIRATVDGFTVGNGMPMVYLKEDGSIPSDGFEIVSHPATFDWWMSNINWTDTFAAMREQSVYPDSRCGMHVHVSKAGFGGAAHEYRWLQFWHRNAEPLTKMARRDPSRWAVFLEKGSEDRDQLKRIAQKKARGYSRYQAINTTNAHTYEVRVFASTVNSVKVRAALGLVDASVEYTRVIRARDIMKDDAWSWTAFRAWVIKQGDKYRHLVKEIERLMGPAELDNETAEAYRTEGD